MAKVGGIERSSVILRMKSAIESGQTASSFISTMKEAGLSYRRSTMLADWRSIGNIESKKGLARYVRKDRTPTARVVADVEWNLSREFMYKVRVETRLRPGEPLETRFINIMTDKPLTPGEVESQAQGLKAQSPKLSEKEVVGIILETVFRRVGM